MPGRTVSGVVEETDSIGANRDAARVLLGGKNIESKVEFAPVTEPRRRAPSAKRAPGVSSPTVLILAGTRPECIKLAPVIHAIAARDDIEAIVGVLAALVAEAVAA